MSKQAHNYLLNATTALPGLNQAIAANGELSLEPQPEQQFFPYLARSIAGQQLSNAAASTIWKRVEQAAGPDLTGFCCQDNYQRLRGCGLSNSKVKTLIGLRDAVVNQTLDPALYHSRDRVFITHELTKLWGVGLWTADMAAIFFFALPDVWAYGDVALMRGLEHFAALEGTEPGMILELTEPYHSYLALHIWECWDTDLLTRL